MPVYIDLDRMCRLCLKSVKVESELIDIFENDENCSLSMRIMACAALEVNRNDALPKNICTDCRYSLEKFYLFRKKCKNADTRLHRHLRLINAGKISNLFDDQDQYDQEEYDECLAFIVKCDANDENKYEIMKRQWEMEKCRWEQEKIQLEKEKQEMENLNREKDEEYERMLNQTQQFEVESHFQEMSVKDEPNDKANNSQKLKTLTDCTEVESGEYDETLFVLEETSNHSDDYELITDGANNYNGIFEEGDATENINAVVRDHSNYILSGNDEIEISFADGESRSNTDDDEHYTNAEYLEIDDEETQEEEEEVIPLQYSSIPKVIRNTIASCSGISADHEGIDCKLFKINGKSTKIAVKTDDDPDKTFFVGIQETNDDTDSGKLNAYCCNICSKSYKSIAELNRHNQKVHEKKQGQNCEWCSKWFPSNSALRRHLRVHTGEKPYKCDECGKKFCQKEILKRHKMIHSGEKPHTCSWCGIGFVQRDILKQHINRKHSANPIINLHKCQQCSKSFYHASGLSRHSLVHTGRKFSCEYCSKSFSDKSAMKRHVGSLHANILKIET